MPRGGSPSDGATPSAGGSGSHATSPGGAYIRQYSENSQVGNRHDISSALSQPVLAGSAVLVLATEFNVGGQPPGSAPPDPIVLDDTLGGSYGLLQTLNNLDALQAAMLFTRYDSDAGQLTVHATFVGLEWQGLVIVEIANVSASPFIASAGKLIDMPSTTADTISSGTMAAGSSPAFVVGFGQNSSDWNGTPKAGTGFTSAGTAWNWHGAEGTSNLPSVLLEYRRVPNPGNVAATFTPIDSNDSFFALGVALKD